MAKHGIVEIDDTGVGTLKESSGVLGMAADAVTSVLSSQKAAIGYTGWIQKAALVIGGNIAGVHSGSGRLGVGVAGKNIFFGK